MGRTIYQKKAAMSKLNKQDIDKLLVLLNDFHQHPTWTKFKRADWNNVLEFLGKYKGHAFTGDHFTYGISAIGEVRIHQPNSPSFLYRIGIRTKCLLICTGHLPRKSRIYKAYGIDIK